MTKTQDPYQKLLFPFLFGLFVLTAMSERDAALATGKYHFDPLPPIYSLSLPPAPKGAAKATEEPKATPSDLEADGAFWIIRKTAAMFAPYKNDRLITYQKLLHKRGIKNTKLYVAQLLQENGALNESVIGDHGCSIGIVQWNACAHANMKAAAYIAKHPEWKDIDFQLSVMADMTERTYKKFNGNIRLSVIAHNCPACAAKGKDSKAGYFASVSKRAALLENL